MIRAPKKPKSIAEDWEMRFNRFCFIIMGLVVLIIITINVMN